MLKFVPPNLPQLSSECSGARRVRGRRSSGALPHLHAWGKCVITSCPASGAPPIESNLADTRDRVFEQPQGGNVWISKSGKSTQMSRSTF